MSNHVTVGRNVVLDGRLALFHTSERWLAVADLHFGYEMSQRAGGNLFPLWGMRTIETRLDELLQDYAPRHLVLLGDLVHDGATAGELAELLKKLRQFCEIVLIAGNHDRRLGKNIDLVDAGKAPVIIFIMDIAQPGRTIAFKSSVIIILRELSGMAQACG
jgi:metallophosphoesterase superfamily enzyme